MSKIIKASKRVMDIAVKLSKCPPVGPEEAKKQVEEHLSEAKREVFGHPRKGKVWGMEAK